jgi:hypothetical protein
MYKKIIVALLAIVLLISFVPSSAFATVLNEDVTISTPVYANFETAAAAQAVDSQLTGDGSTAVLADDAKEGDFSLKVTTTNETPDPYAQYTLVTSEQFDIAENSNINLWVKTGNGASWISFYSNSALITCDMDGDGQFEVGTDLDAGKWTLLTLDLLNTDTVITVGDDLIVRSNDNSVWSFDEVKALGTKTTSIDLSKMVNSNTTLNNGKLEFNKTVDSTAYVATPTTIVSNRNLGFEKVFNKQTDFAGGIFYNCSGLDDGSIVGYSSIWNYTSPIIDISTVNAISYGYIVLTTSTGTTATVQTSLSLDGGNTWTGWLNVGKNGNISGISKTVILQNARIKYKISGTKAIEADKSIVTSVNLFLKGDDNTLSSVSGFLNGIKIDSKIVNNQGNETYIYDTMTYTFLNTASNLIMSGNGKFLFYINPTDGCIYRIDVTNGLNTLYINKTALSMDSISSFKVNYDGTVLCILGIYYGNTYLVKFDSKVTTSKKTLVAPSNIPISYDIQDSGGIIYSYYVSGSNAEYIVHCSPDNTISTLQSLTMGYSTIPDTINVCICDTSNDYIYSISYYTYSPYTYHGSTYSSKYGVISLTSAFSSSFKLSNAGDFLYYGNVMYNLKNSTQRILNTNGAQLKVMNDNKLLLIKDGYCYSYDTATGFSTIITYLPDYSSFITADDFGKSIVYKNTTNNVRIKTTNATDKVNKYLLSFDGKNTWYSYSSGTWVKVSDKKTPDTDTLTKYGMTAEQINALSADNFESLYADGNEIYTVDVAVYFQSVSPNYSPSINSIKIITDANSYDDASYSTSNPLYAAKSVDFNGSDWREVKKIYPVEICNKASEFIYFFYSEGKYSYYDGSAWQTETETEIADMIADVDTNWIDLKLIGMKTEEVRQIPTSTLTTQFAGKDFSVVYCMKVPDVSTTGYYSLITSDYTADIYASENLVLNIKYTDGTTEQIAGMTSGQIEDFMSWLLNHTKKSSTYYTITVGNIHYSINYYTVSKATVTES